MAGDLPMPGVYFKLLLRQFGATRELASRIVAGTCIKPAEGVELPADTTITLGQQLQQFRNVSEIAPVGWGLEVGRSLDGAAHGDLGIATASAPNLGEALSVLETFAHVRAPYFRLMSSIRGEDLLVRIERKLWLSEGIWVPLVEVLTLSIQALVESAFGRPMNEGEFRFPYGAPDYHDRYNEFFHTSVAFDEPIGTVVIPASWLPLPCPFADPVLHRTAVSRLELAERYLQGEEFVVARIERILEGFGDSTPSLARVAREMRMSRRTLARRLAQREASFRDLAQAHRRNRAIALLGDPSLTVAEVGHRLGYAEPANFGRAFRRWLGCSPSGFRAKSDNSSA